MKKVLYAIAALVAVYLILCLAGPKSVKVERSIGVNAPADMVKAKLADFHFFNTWSPWNEKDPNMKMTYSGETGQPGSGYAWEGNKEVGKGSMEYLGTSGDSVKEKVIFTEPHQGGGDVYFIVMPEGNSSNVSWGMTFDVAFPGRAFMLFMNMEKQMAPDFEKGLNNMKNKLEAENTTEKTYNGYKVKEADWQERNYFGRRETLSFEKMQPFFATNFPKIYADAAKNKLIPGPPSAIFYSYDEAGKKADCAAVITAGDAKELKGWDKFTIPASKVLWIEYYGAYEKSANAHNAMNQYIKEKNLKQAYVVEEYITDPMTEKDTSKWLTNIYYVVNP